MKFPSTFSLFRASCRIRTNDPEITNHVLWPTELKRRGRWFESDKRLKNWIYSQFTKEKAFRYLPECFSFFYICTLAKYTLAKCTVPK